MCFSVVVVFFFFFGTKWLQSMSVYAVQVSLGSGLSLWSLACTLLSKHSLTKKQRKGNASNIRNSCRDTAVPGSKL